MSPFGKESNGSQFSYRQRLRSVPLVPVHPVWNPSTPAGILFWYGVRNQNRICGCTMDKMPLLIQKNKERRRLRPPPPLTRINKGKWKGKWKRTWKEEIEKGPVVSFSWRTRKASPRSFYSGVVGLLDAGVHEASIQCAISVAF